LSWTSALAATHGREKGNFIAGMERSGPRSKFLVARGYQRSAETSEFRVIHSIVGEKRLDRRAIGELDGIFGLADDFFEPSEEKDLYTSCL
jgi:hypothetical protein